MAENVARHPARGAVADIEKRQEEAGADYEVGLESLSQYQLAWRKFKKHRMALIGLGDPRGDDRVAIVGPFIWPFDRDIPAAGQDRRDRPAAVAGHPFGETGLQRDVFTLIVNGARTSLFIGFGA